MKKKFLSYCLVATGLLLASCANSQPTFEGIEITSRGGVTSIEVGETLQLEAKVHPEGAIQTVTWSSDNTNFATISDTGLVTAVAPGNVMLTATSTENTSITNSFALTVKAKTSTGDDNNDDTETTIDWSKQAFATHEQFVDSDGDTPLKVKGKITYAGPVNEGLVSYYIQNGTDGYYIYKQDTTKFPIDVSKSYEVGGFKKYHQGTNEIVNVEYLKESSETFTITTTDVSSLNFNVLNDMKPYHGSRVTLKGVEISSTPSVSDSKAYSIYVKNGSKEISLRVDPANMSSEEFTAINNKFKSAPVGTTLEVTGVMSAFGYSNSSVKTQMAIFKADEITIKEASDSTMVDNAKNALYLQNSVKAGQASITLPTTISGYDGVAVSWESANKSIITDDGAVTQPDTTTDVKLVATIKKNQASTTKDIYVTVFGKEDVTNAVASLNFEDAEAPNGSGYGGTSPTKSGYDEGVITLGTPSTQWLLRNTLISKCGSSDIGNGSYTARLRNNSDAAESGRIENKSGYDFNMLEFDAALYGNDSAITLVVEYSTDGTTWTKLDRQYVISSKTLETIRVSIPGDGSNKRIAICAVAGTGNRCNIDDIRLIKVN